MENNKLEERLNRIEHKMDVMFNEIINIKIHLKKDAIKTRIEEFKIKKENIEEELKFLNMDLDNIWQDSSSSREEYNYVNYNDVQQTEIGG